MYTCILMYMYLCITHVHLYINVYVYLVYTCVYLCIPVYISLFTCVCLSIYMHALLFFQCMLSLYCIATVYGVYRPESVWLVLNRSISLHPKEKRIMRYISVCIDKAFIYTLSFKWSHWQWPVLLILSS